MNTLPLAAGWLESNPPEREGQLALTNCPEARVPAMIAWHELFAGEARMVFLMGLAAADDLTATREKAVARGYAALSATADLDVALLAMELLPANVVPRGTVRLFLGFAPEADVRHHMRMLAVWEETFIATVKAGKAKPS